ncbi:hypothetical protein FOA52_007761 [Chlamydomonas sp. UWO 241]|nr:hypothetical protein FOA52_007761 [Chlamydomonas sp. UWO 241]
MHCRPASWPCIPSAWDKVVSAGMGALLGACLLLGASGASGAAAATQVAQQEGGPQVMRLPASPLPGVYEAQRTILEAWGIVGETFVDGALNGRDWPTELRAHMMAAYSSTDTDAAFAALDDMLAGLGDPYTRRVPPVAYERFRVDSDGELQGVGLLIARSPAEHGGLLVLAPVHNSPAERAGVLPGDEVLTIDGHGTQGLSGEQAAQLLRGSGGSEVRVQLVRRSDQLPGVAGLPPPAVRPLVERTVSLRRERIEVSPLYHTALVVPPSPGAPAGAPQRTAGYMRLSQFSSNAPADVAAAIEEFESAGVDEYILDLRSNPGGLVSSSIELARLFLDGDQPVFLIQPRDGGVVVQTTQTNARALTTKPLAVLVNANSASASEILSGALRDNGRAKVIGAEHTFGKGRIQSVFELQDGSALFVTVAKYVTPGGTVIDGRGIAPDLPCTPVAFRRGMLAIGGVSSSAAGTFEMGGVIQALPPPDATGFSPGLPLSPAMEVALNEQLTRNDKCVAAAEDTLSREVDAQVESQRRILALDAQLKQRVVSRITLLAEGPQTSVHG